MSNSQQDGWVAGVSMKARQGAQVPIRYDFRVAEGRRAIPLIRVHMLTGMYAPRGCAPTPDLEEAKRMAIAHLIEIQSAQLTRIRMDLDLLRAEESRLRAERVTELEAKLAATEATE